MPTPELNAVIENRVLDETEQALRELCTAARNCGLSKVQMSVMLHKVADDLCPPLIITPNATMQ